MHCTKILSDRDVKKTATQFSDRDVKITATQLMAHLGGAERCAADARHAPGRTRSAR